MKRDPQTWLGAARRLRGALQAVHANSGALLRLIDTLEGKQASAVPKCRRNTDAAVGHAAWLALAAALDRAVATVERALGARPVVYLTGGDAEAHPAIKSTVNAIVTAAALSPGAQAVSECRMESPGRRLTSAGM